MQNEKIQSLERFAKHADLIMYRVEKLEKTFHKVMATLFLQAKYRMCFSCLKFVNRESDEHISLLTGAKPCVICTILSGTQGMIVL